MKTLESQNNAKNFIDFRFQLKILVFSSFFHKLSIDLFSSNQTSVFLPVQVFLLLNAIIHFLF